jgi:hypothetical protein
LKNSSKNYWPTISPESRRIARLIKNLSLKNKRRFAATRTGVPD